MLLGELLVAVGVISYYQAEGLIVFEDDFSSGLDEQFAELFLFNDTICPAKDTGILQEAVSSILTIAAPSVQAEQDFKMPFMVNCSLYFDNKVEKIICDTQYRAVEALDDNDHIDGLLDSDITYLHKGNIFKSFVVVGLPPISHPQVHTKVYFKLPPTESSTKSDSATKSHTQTLSEGGESKSQENSDTTSATSLFSLSSSKTVSNSETIIPTPSYTQMLSESQGVSYTTSATLTPSKDLSITNSESISLIESDSATRVETKSHTQTLSNSDESKSQESSDTVSALSTFSLSSSKAASNTETIIPTISLAKLMRWSLSAYADATNQGGRYNIVNPGANAIVNDMLTSLMWEQTVGGTSVTWSATSVAGSAQAYCSSVSKGGYSDWRVPTVVELQSLVDYTIGSGVTINAIAFPSTPSSYFWAAQIYAANTAKAWDLRFSSGGYIQPDGSVGSTSFAVRCVRGSTYNSVPQFTDENGGALTGGSTQVKDQVTGLIWQRSQAPSTYTWSNAVSYCSTTLTLGGEVWRLPTLKELTTIVDYKLYNPSINSAAFPSTSNSYFWSNSPFAGGAGSSWVVYFSNGGAGYGGQTGNVYVRCVR